MALARLISVTYHERDLGGSMQHNVVEQEQPSLPLLSVRRQSLDVIPADVAGEPPSTDQAFDQFLEL
ncbi:hypothetical protein UK23_27035 [Lentzea aerocolonigenes]|uniref:Uncharacterized protein n=1 Tax=Lentzea aerocolonigenes TaxID=68170 RepID=A0A0F0GT35_LENAE|nr:hypothetical protein [Lentzea aerocolonigenes]KJK45182.1 hypothetical protein UK23_27035 [Lentzea aerocolonigenes]